jgi:hypothetical protein
MNHNSYNTLAVAQDDSHKLSLYYLAGLLPEFNSPIRKVGRVGDRTVLGASSPQLLTLFFNLPPNFAGSGYDCLENPQQHLGFLMGDEIK